MLTMRCDSDLEEDAHLLNSLRFPNGRSATNTDSEYGFKSWLYYGKTVPRELRPFQKESPLLFSEGYLVGKEKKGSGIAYTQVAMRQGVMWSIKTIRKTSKNKDGIFDEMAKGFIKQYRKLFLLKHPNILRNCMLYETTRCFYIVREFAEKGSVADIIEREGFVEEPLAQKYFKQLVCAVCYLHSKGIVHGNIKCQNVLVCENDEVKLADPHVSCHYRDWHSTGNHHFNAGSPICYTAPEIVRTRRIKEPLLPDSNRLLDYVKLHVCKLTFRKYLYILSDTWSLGIVLFYMLWGHAPYTDLEYSQLVDGYYIKPSPTVPNKRGALSVSKSAKQLYTRILVTDITIRPRADQVYGDDWTQRKQLLNEEKENEKFLKLWRNRPGAEMKLTPRNVSKPDKLNLAKLRLENQNGIANSLKCPSKREKQSLHYKPGRLFQPDPDLRHPCPTTNHYYATFIPTQYTGQPLSSCIAISAQRTSMKHRQHGFQVPGAPFIPMFTLQPAGENETCNHKMVWLQSDLFGRDKDDHPSVSPRARKDGLRTLTSLLMASQLYHAVMYKIKQGKPTDDRPEYGLAWIHPNMFKSMDTRPTSTAGGAYRGAIPETFDDPTVWEYLVSIIDNVELFEKEFVRLGKPVVDKLVSLLKEHERRVMEGKVFNELPISILQAMDEIIFVERKSKRDVKRQPKAQPSATESENTELL